MVVFLVEATAGFLSPPGWLYSQDHRRILQDTPLAYEVLIPDSEATLHWVSLETCCSDLLDPFFIERGFFSGEREIGERETNGSIVMT